MIGRAGFLFRSMEENDGFPAIAMGVGTKYSLSVRPGTDLSADGSGTVRPGEGGLSVFRGDPRDLPRFLLPPEFGGTCSKCVLVWAISMFDLGEDLSYRADPYSRNHGFVEPSYVMTFARYQEALHATKGRWQRTEHPGIMNSKGR